MTGRKKDGGVGERQGQESRNKNVERGGHKKAKEMDRERVRASSCFRKDGERH